MGSRGPQPTPTALMLLKGNPSKKQINLHEPRPIQSADPEPPGWLDGAGRTIWEQFKPMMVRLNLLTEADVDAFAKYCETYAQWLEFRDFVKRNGIGYPVYEPVYDSAGKVVMDPKTNQPAKVLKEFKEWPHVKRADVRYQQMLQYEKMFGLTPATRTAISAMAGNGGDQNPVATFLFGPRPSSRPQLDEPENV